MGDTPQGPMFIENVTPSDGDVPVFDAAEGIWRPGAGGGGGGGHVSRLYDETTDDLLLLADQGALLTQDNVDFHSHGKLDNTGKTYNGGPQPTWFDPTASAWDEKGWFGFFYGGPFSEDAFDFQIGWGEQTEALEVHAAPDLNQINMFAASADQEGDGTELLILWDHDGNKRVSIGGYNDADVWQTAMWDPLVTPTDPGAITIYDVVDLSHNATRGVSNYLSNSTDGGYVEMGSSPGNSYLLAKAGASQTVENFAAQASGGALTLRTTGDNKLGFFNATPAAKPTGVAITAGGIHAALVTLGLIAA